MRFFITCDSFWEAKIEKVIDAIEDTGFDHFFSTKDYGVSLDSITVVLMCHNSSLNLKQRIRYNKKENELYIDIMLRLVEFLNNDQKSKENKIAESLLAQIPAIIRKYNLPDFNLRKFEKDLAVSLEKFL